MPAAVAEETPACEEEDLNCDVLVVTASRAEQVRANATAPVDVLDRDRIVASGATTLDDLLRTVPGLQVTPSQGGASVALQGMDPEHTLILVDGRPLAGRVDGVVDLARIPVSDLERVEILPGAASALYGSEALGGVVNLVTRRGADRDEAEVALRGGSRRLAEGNAALRGTRGPLKAGASAYRNAQDGWDADPEDVATTGDDTLAWGVRSWGRARHGTGLTVDADADYGQRDTRGVEASPAGAEFDVRTLQETANAGLAASRWNGAASTLSARLSGTLWRQQYLEDQRGSAIQDAYQDTVDRRLAGNLAWTWAPKGHLVSSGVDAWLEGLESERLADGVASRRRVALYAQDDWALTERAAVSPGGRVDLDSQFGLNATPHLALRLSPADSVRARLSLGQGYRAPEFKELYLAFDHAAYGYTLEGNEALRPERSDNATLDVRGVLAERIELRARGWWNEVTDLINPELLVEGTEGSPARYAYQNVGRAVTRGGSAGVGWVQQGPWSAGLDYTLTDARDRADDAPLDGRARHHLTANLQARPLRTLEASLLADVNSARPFTLDGETTWAPGYALLDARLAWRAWRGIELSAGARNLLDARDDATLGLPPRTIYVGLRGEARHTPKERTP